MRRTSGGTDTLHGENQREISSYPELRGTEKRSAGRPFRKSLYRRADALVLPDIEAGNVFYKTITLFAGARTAAVVQGATRPVVLTSRGDDATCKYDSLCMALMLAAAAPQHTPNP